MDIIEVLLVNLIIANYNYQQNQEYCIHLLLTSKSFGSLLDISPKNFMFLKTFDSGFSCIEACITDRTSNPLEIEDKININLVIN